MHHDFRLYAHRGCPADLPENTMPAFQRALDLGVYALEMDVHLTRDGHPLVSHDPEATRMGGRSAAWRDLDLRDEYGEMAAAMQPLCRPDCPGICPVCGTDISIAPCQCDLTPIDPRWQALVALKKKNG